MGIKTKIKKLFEQKAYLPISHPVSSEKEFEGKVALISGGSGGIGMSIAKSLKESGCTVIVAGTNEKKLDAIKLQNELDTIVMDYSCPDTFNSVVQEVVSKHLVVPVFCSSHSLHFFVKIPSPHIFCLSTASFIYSNSFPVNGGTLKLIILFSNLHSLNYAYLFIIYFYLTLIL